MLTSLSITRVEEVLRPGECSCVMLMVHGTHNVACTTMFSFTHICGVSQEFSRFHVYGNSPLTVDERKWGLANGLTPPEAGSMLSAIRVPIRGPRYEFLSMFEQVAPHPLLPPTRSTLLPATRPTLLKYHPPDPHLLHPPWLSLCPGGIGLWFETL